MDREEEEAKAAEVKRIADEAEKQRVTDEVARAKVVEKAARRKGKLVKKGKGKVQMEGENPATNVLESTSGGIHLSGSVSFAFFLVFCKLMETSSHLLPCLQCMHSSATAVHSPTPRPTWAASLSCHAVGQRGTHSLVIHVTMWACSVRLTRSMSLCPRNVKQGVQLAILHQKK